ncbi:GNAT family N-acetyltransferase [Lentibacillus sp. N15]|uniref:GNAT family N-acetyltransferase n=1 Tax=Lentibacillus songyuanensis TaxID=3136161 RepID=UPI0031B9DCD1
MPRLMNALHQSLYVLTAWDESKLIGLIMLIGDGHTVIYIQDILILKAYQNNEVGSQLMNKVLEKYHDVRQKVLLTDDVPDVRTFSATGALNERIVRSLKSG